MGRAGCASGEAFAPPGPPGGGVARRCEQRGQGTVEYGLLLAAAALLASAGMLFLAGGVRHLLDRTGEAERARVAEPPVFAPPSASCDSSYEGVCIPSPPPDLDCPDLVQRGVPVPVTVSGSDPHDLDPDGDGLGC